MSEEDFDHRDDYERLFDKKYLRWFHLNGKPALLEIVSIKQEELTVRGGKKQKSPVIVFKQIQGSIESIKPLVMIATNMESLASFLGRKTSLWIGKKFVVYQDKTPLNRKIVPCIRIREPQRQQAKDTAK